MTIRTGTTEVSPTHHVKLTDRAGNAVGLILCNDKGEPAPTYNKTPIDRTALKTTSGGGSYADFNYPYSPIVQDDWSGGRGNLDFERDTTRYYDGYRVNTRHPNKVILGPQEHFSTGYKTMEALTITRYTVYGAIPQEEVIIGLATYTAQPVMSFIPSGTYTVARIWLKVRKVGSPSDATLRMVDTLNSNPEGTGTLTAADFTDTLGKWVAIPITVAATAAKRLALYATGTFDANNYWEFVYRLKGVALTTNQATYLVETATTDDTCIYYEYKGQQYKVLSPTGSAPTIWMNGDRGAADANTAQLTKTIDATKSWTVNEWAGCVVKIVQGPGCMERTPYRTITSNTATELIHEAWTVTHDGTTEYVILGSDKWKAVTGHGLTVPVTAVLPVNEVVYFAQGDYVKMRSHREYNNAGTWTDNEWREEASGRASDFAVYLDYQALANKICIAHNNASTSVELATPVAYGTNLTTGGLVQVGFDYEFINGIEVYPSDSGVEALWVYKEDIAYIVTTQAEQIKLAEMRQLRSRTNGEASLVHNVYSYFSLGNGLQRYYGGNIDSVGPNLDEGLPADRQGRIVQLLGYPGRIMAIIDGGTTGYSSLLERSGSGWHEVYRAPKGEQLKAMALQVVPGLIDRLWLYQGNLSIWIPIASEGVSELNDSAYTYTNEGAIILSRMHSGMYDIQKLIRYINIWADNLVWSVDNSTARVQVNVDYRMNDDTDWTAITGTLITSPRSTLDMTSVYGLAGRRIQLRIRLQSDDNMTTPILLATTIDAVARTQVKYMYNLTFRVLDDEPTLAAREMDEDSVTAASMSAITKLQQIEAWADADTDSLLYMTSSSPLYDGKYVFINPPVTRQIALDPDPTRQWTGTAYVCSTTAQEA